MEERREKRNAVGVDVPDDPFLSIMILKGSLSEGAFCFFEPRRKERRRMYRGTLFYTLLIRQPALRKLRSVATFSRKRRLL